MEDVVFTKHALVKLAQRNIPMRSALATIRRPQKMALEGEKFCAFRQFGKKFLKVVFVKVEERIVVLTQFYVRFPS